jgi:uncharacterized protein (DUF1810 family)
MNDLKRFLNAQQLHYTIALDEIKNGQRRSHWMWYIFPKITGLGMTDRSRYYAIKDIGEAGDFLQNEQLNLSLVNICKALLALETNDAYAVFGNPDDLKLRSSMTLFDAVPATFRVFGQVLEEFFHGERDQLTLQLLTQQKTD